MMNFQVIDIEKDEDTECLIGQAGFIKTVEDLYECLISSTPTIKFGLAFCEASGKKLVRSEGNDDSLKELAEKNAMKIGAGHSFIILFKESFPINILNSVKGVQEVSNVYCATSNSLQVVVADTDKGRGIMGVVDGEKPLGIETEEDVKDRYDLLRKFGYKR